MNRTAAAILAVWIAGLGAAAQFGKMSVIYDLLAPAYPGHGPAAFGLAVSIVGLVGLVLGTTAGLLVTRAGQRRTLLAALAAGAALSALQATMPAFPVLILTRLLEGLSHLAIVVAGPTLIAALAPPAQRPLAMTLWSSFFGVTYAVLALAAPPLVALGGARAVLLAHAGFMAGAAVLLALLLPADAPSAPRAGGGGLLARHLAIYASPRMAAPAMGFFCYTFLYVAVLTLLPPEVPPSHRLAAATGMPLVSIAVSLTLGVRLQARIGAVGAVQAGYLAAIPAFLALALFWGSGAGMLAAGLWLSGALGVVQGASFSAIPELNATAEDRAGAAGAIAQLGNLGTTTGTPLLAVVLSAAGAPGLAAAAVLACLCGVALHALQARRRQALTT
ncbi:MAG: MFS transporter [Rhodobacteraceae bacterium]|nr:MFS transporter [Paracoccaceae bacterium]